MSLWYALGFLLLLGLVQMYYLGPVGRPLPYSEFKTLLRDGRVAEVVVGEQTIRGTLKDAATGSQGQSKQFTTHRIEDPKLVEELESRQVKYSGEMVNRWLRSCSDGCCLSRSSSPSGASSSAAWVAQRVA